jgi:LIVCS family branched-chain amino acid:cation transporter
MVIAACLTTSVGLVSACSSFFHKLLPGVPYKVIAIILSVFSAVIANVGLTQLIAISVPVLTAIYPLAIVLIFLTLLHPLFKGRAEVYQGSLLVTFIVSMFDGLNAAGVKIAVVNDVLTKLLPMHEVGLGWIFPAVIGGLIGYGISVVKMKNELHPAARANKKIG